jgi:diphthamide synthase (EF-2-diphthine--ammonia ligase)
LALPHHVLPVIPPFESGYETGLRRLQDEMGIDCVITGDISEVGGNPNWVGRELDDAALAELQRVREQAGLDLCGEEGEYHTLVIDGPSFTRAIDIRSHAVRTMASLAYMEIHHAELRERFI